MNFEQQLAMALGSKELELIKCDQKILALQEENKALKEKNEAEVQGPTGADDAQ